MRTTVPLTYHLQVRKRRQKLTDDLLREIAAIQKDPESNFAICLQLEIPLRGFLFQMTFSETHRKPKSITNHIVQRISFEKEIPSGDLRQEACRKHPVLRNCSFRSSASKTRRRMGIIIFTIIKHNYYKQIYIHISIYL